MTAIDVLPPVLSIRGVQRYLGGISRSGVYNLLPRLESVKIGSRRMVTVSSLDALIQTSKEAS